MKHSIGFRENCYRNINPIHRPFYETVSAEIYIHIIILYIIVSMLYIATNNIDHVYKNIFLKFVRKPAENYC
jgi:hypothetical protein